MIFNVFKYLLNFIKMKKKSFIIISVIVLTIGGGAGFNYQLNNAQMYDLPNKVVANIEALASNENGEQGECPRNAVANTKCQIWKIIYSQGGGWPDISCETDPSQSHKCAEGTCPHGN